MFLVWSLIDRSIELALNLVPFKSLLSLFIYFVVLRKGFLRVSFVINTSFSIEIEDFMDSLEFKPFNY